MDALPEIERLLNDNGAILIREKGHPVYKLKDGQKFVMSSTPSDHRSMKNSLSELRKLLNVRTEPKVPEVKLQKPKVVKPQPQEFANQIAALEGRLVEAQNRFDEEHQRFEQEHQKVLNLQLEVTLLQRAGIARTLPAFDPDLKPTDRLRALISSQEQEQTRIMGEAEICDKRIKVLKALEPMANDSGFEEVLGSVLPQAKAPRPVVASTPQSLPKAPPQTITNRVQVTRELVFVATQTFPDTFNTNDVMERMVNGTPVEAQERNRIRQNIANALLSLEERGQINRLVQGIGRQQTVWGKADQTAVIAQAHMAEHMTDQAQHATV